MKLQCQKSLFSLPEDVVYLRCAGSSPMMKKVRDAGLKGLAKKNMPWSVTLHDAYERVDVLRELVGELISAPANCIAVAPSASFCISIAARNIPIEFGQTIVMLDRQFPSNVYPWLDAASRTGAVPIYVGNPKDNSWTDAVIETINETTAVVAIPQCHWLDGAMIDVERVSEKCRALSVPLVLDVTQSLGAVPLDVKTIQPDFLVAATEKWLLGPYQLAVGYVSPKWHDGVPIDFNWITRKNSRDYNGLVNYTDEYEPGAVRFDVGERGNFTTVPMQIEALKQILSWGVPNISETIAPLIELCCEYAVDLNLTAVDSSLRAPHMTGIRGKIPSQIVQILDSQNIYISVRDNVVRIAPHVFNTEADIESLFAAIEREI